MLWSPWVFLVGMLRQWPSWWNGAEGNLICKGSCYTATPHGKFKARRRQGDADVRGLLWQKSLATTQSINIVLFHGSLPASLDHTWDPWVDMIASVLQISADTFNIIYLITSRKQPGTPMDFPWWSRHLQPISRRWTWWCRMFILPRIWTTTSRWRPLVLGRHWAPLDTWCWGRWGLREMAHEITEWIVHYMMNIEIKEKGHNMKWWTRFSIKRNVNWLARHGPSWSPFNAYQVGIEDCLHIEFEPLGASSWVHVPSPFPMVHEAWDGRLELRYDKSKYHMKDVIIGKATADISW